MYQPNSCSKGQDHSGYRDDLFLTESEILFQEKQKRLLLLEEYENVSYWEVIRCIIFWDATIDPPVGSKRNVE